ncbi:Protein SYM1 [Cytospora mali]|uniref:Protein SYM1 n=1 Tax=Cytospora mali TaxID=578113 RepID=A0A194VWB6_CYTMA|nr:Protein SYM1 [Valsa mali]
MATASPLYRVLLRRQAHSLRNGTRHQQQQRRWQSSKPEPDAPTKEIPTPNMVPTVDVPFWLRLGPLTRSVQAYGRAQRKRPWITQLCTSLTIYFFADLSAQRINGKEYDPERTCRSIIIGGISSIPSFEWFMWLSRNFNYSSRILSIGTKIVINQTIFTPIFNTYFFGMQAFLAGDNLIEVWERVKRTVPTSIANSIKLWPIVTAINFGYVPIEYRSIFAGTIAVGWQTYLTWLNRLAEEEEARLRPSGRIPPSGMNTIQA